MAAGECAAPQAKRRRYSADDYARLIGAHERGEDVANAASTLGINPESARTILRRYERGGKASPGRRGGARNTPFNKHTIFGIIREFYSDPCHADATLGELQRHLLAEPNVSCLPMGDDGQRRCVSQATLCKWLNDELLFTLKVATPEPSLRNTAQLKESRRDFALWLHGVDPRRLLYFDEHGFNLWTTRKRARAPSGQRARVPVSIQKMLNCTVAACVNPVLGKVNMHAYFGGFTGDKITDFLRESRELWAARVDNETKYAGCVFILDNCPSHRADILERALPAPHGFRFLTPYSPQLNIIENVFNMHKAAIRSLHAEHRAQVIAIDSMPRGERTLRRRNMLERFCVEGWERISSQSVYGTWLEMNRILPRCLELQDI